MTGVTGGTTDILAGGDNFWIKSNSDPNGRKNPKSGRRGRLLRMGNTVKIGGLNLSPFIPLEICRFFSKVWQLIC